MEFHPAVHHVFPFSKSLVARSRRISKLERRSAASTHPGWKRQRNEDQFGVDDEMGLYLVADGMGGAPCGELASQIATDTIRESMASFSDAVEPGLERAIQRAHRRIHQATAEGAERYGMGTTVAALMLDGQHQAVIAHVGDSRVYRWSSGRLDLLTEDHSLAESMDGWLLGARTPKMRAFRSLLTRALGEPRKRQVEVDLARWMVRSGDYFLLCSDGLTDMVEKNEIQACFEAEKEPQAICDRLVARALEEGGLDNVTAVVLALGGEGEST